MSKQKHTPGPWELYIDGTRPGIEAPDASLSIVIFGDKGDDGGVRGGTKPEAFANAALIAASPELLQALLDCTAGLEAYTKARGLYDDPRVKAARAAIAKATGGAS